MHYLGFSVICDMETQKDSFSLTPRGHTHIHTHLHTHSHSGSYAHPHTQILEYTHPHTHARPSHTDTQAPAQADAHANTPTEVHTDSHILSFPLSHSVSPEGDNLSLMFHLEASFSTRLGMAQLLAKCDQIRQN